MHKAQTTGRQERQRATDSTTARPTARPEISRLADHALSTPNIMLAAPMAPMLRLPPIAQARAAPPSMDILSDPSLFLYELQLSADSLVSQQLGGTLTPFSGLSLFGAGLLTSLTPCCLSMLPITFAFLASGADGGTSSSDASFTSSSGSSISSSSSSSSLPSAIAFTAGVATALAALGVVAASLGRVYGDAGGDGASDILRLVVAAITVALGMNLLNLLPMRLGFGSLAVDPTQLGLSVPPAIRAFLFGASSAVVASPCASPVLASILAYVATLGDPLLGGLLLLAYTLGYTAPVLATSLLATSARDVSRTLEGSFEWVGPVGGTFLVATGTYNFLVAGFGPV